MQADVKQYVRSCARRQVSKTGTQVPAGLLHSLDTPTQPWESINHDFVTHLPRTKSKYDTVLTVVDRFTKRILLIPTTNRVIAPETASLVFEQVFRHYGMPKSVVSDRDPRFTSIFWRTLFKLTGTDLRMSSSSHPETDGQTERGNRTWEDMLRAVTKESK